MKRLGLFIAALVIAVGTMTHGAIAREASQADMFRHGVGVHRLLNWASVSPSDRTSYAWPPFASSEHVVSDVLIARVAAAGFDFVRLTVDPGPFLQMTDEKRDGLDRTLLATIQRIRSHGLSVLVNFHSNTQVPQYAPDMILAIRDTALFRDYLQLIARTAGLLDSLNDPGVALEPVNEPPAGYDDASTAQWQSMMEDIYRAARAKARRLLIVVTGAQGGSRTGLTRLNPRPFLEGNVLYSFHYYEPHIFTHQGVVSSEPQASFWRYLSNLPYPYDRRDERAVLREVEKAIAEDARPSPVEKSRLMAAAKHGIERYFQEQWQNQKIEAAFDEVASWAARYGIDQHRIILGEFGATRSYSGTQSINADARASWLQDVRSAAERRDFHWSVWELNGSGGMAIAGPTPDRLDLQTIRALGLASPLDRNGERRR